MGLFITDFIYILRAWRLLRQPLLFLQEPLVLWAGRMYTLGRGCVGVGFLERVKSITLKVLPALMSFSKEICTSNTLKRFFLIKCFNSSLKTIWSQDWSWYIAKGTTDPRHWELWLIQHLSFKAEVLKSFGILIKLKPTFFLAKGEKYIKLWQIHFTT